MTKAYRRSMIRHHLEWAARRMKRIQASNTADDVKGLAGEIEALARKAAKAHGEHLDETEA